MYNMFVSAYRRRTKFETQYDPENYIERESIAASQDVKMELDDVRAAMKSISSDHREILTLVCVKGMQYAEVSEALQIPVGTVRSRLSRAREALMLEMNSLKTTDYAPHINVHKHDVRMAA